jgi:hypothetical protein
MARFLLSIVLRLTGEDPGFTKEYCLNLWLSSFFSYERSNRGGGERLSGFKDYFGLDIVALL